MKSAGIKLCVVIPVHNRKQFTKECLDSLKAQTFRANCVIVVDDGSTDGTTEMLRDEYPKVKVLVGDGSLFWTAAINKGIRLALAMKTDYVMTLNNDTVPSVDFLEKMMDSAIDNPDALLGALDVDRKTKRPYYGGELFNWRSGTSTFLLKVLPWEEQNGLHEVSLLPGRGLLIPRMAFEKIGLFAEKALPHYMADYDFTQRARKHGFKTYCNYDGILYTYPEEGGDVKLRAKKSLPNYFRHLFSIRGGGNLRNFTVYTLRNCPLGDIPMALLMGYSRRLAGFWLK